MLNPEYVDIENGIVKLGFTNNGEQAVEIQIEERDLIEYYKMIQEHLNIHNLERLKSLLKTVEGRKQLQSELGDYKSFISMDDVNKIAPALLFWME